MDDWAIVIPSGHPWNLRQLLESVTPETRKRVVAVVAPGYPVVDPTVHYVVRPPGPFIFSRSVNAGMATIPRHWDAIMTSDDVTFLTDDGPEKLVFFSRMMEGRGLVCPSVHGNRFDHPELKPRGRPDLRMVPRPSPLPIICGVIPAGVRAAVGEWDESFAGYGYEDHDYVRRTESAGFSQMVYHGIEIFHEVQRSVYRWKGKESFNTLLLANRRRYFEKWGVWPQR